MERLKLNEIPIKFLKYTKLRWQNNLEMGNAPWMGCEICYYCNDIITKSDDESLYNCLICPLPEIKVGGYPLCEYTSKLSALHRGCMMYLGKPSKDSLAWVDVVDYFLTILQQAINERYIREYYDYLK